MYVAMCVHMSYVGYMYTYIVIKCSRTEELMTYPSSSTELKLVISQSINEMYLV